MREVAALEARGAAAARAPAAEYADALLPAYTEPAAGGDQLQFCQAAMQRAAQQAQMRTLSGAPAVRCARRRSRAPPRGTRLARPARGGRCGAHWAMRWPGEIVISGVVIAGDGGTGKTLAPGCAPLLSARPGKAGPQPGPCSRHVRAALGCLMVAIQGGRTVSRSARGRCMGTVLGYLVVTAREAVIAA